MRQITVHQQEPYKKLGDLYGLFFEDINHAADGGLYAELVQNRSFEYCEIDKPEYHALLAWEKSEGIEWEVREQEPLNCENTHYLHVEAAEGKCIRNLGYNSGIFVEAGKKYDFSVFAKNASAVCETVKDAETSACRKDIMVAIVDDNGKVYAKGCVTVQGNTWSKYELTLEATDTTWNGRLVLTFTEGVYELDMVSLFPRDTFMGRRNGLRKDIAEALKEMQPKFMRFPGGCLVHDGNLDDHARDSMYRWKRTLGKVEERPSWRNNWRYNQTLGLGYYEYFCLCEDLGAKPLPVLPGGFNPHKGEGVPFSELGEWVQDALDLIEFANGSVDTKWGSIRAEMGHPEPFHMEYIGIGNEEIGEGFFERYPYFHEAIKAKYPEMKVINTAGPFAVGEGYEAGWESARRHGSDLVDEHYYSAPEWFLANMHHYEDYDENGPKIFLGEYASWGNTYYNALVEAAYMTHLEHSKAVALACYAPMLCNVDYVNWQPDMLWFDNHRIMKTPNYYVQKLFMSNQGTDAVHVTKKDFDTSICLLDEQNIAGDIVICGNDVEGRIGDIQVMDCVTGEVKSLSDVEIKEDNHLNTLLHIDSSHYKLTFRFRRSKGRKGLKIFFGRQNERNTLMWEFGGWDNWDCNIASIYNGRASTISHRIFHVEDIEYLLELEIEGRNIRTWVNGVNYNDTTDHLPELEDLYITASTDADTGQTYLKVVNLTGEAKETAIALEGEQKQAAVVTALKGYELTAANSLDEPNCVVPVTENVTVQDNKLVYTFAAHSVTVLAFM